jgi:DNA-binding NtrC family response regulator
MDRKRRRRVLIVSDQANAGATLDVSRRQVAVDVRRVVGRAAVEESARAWAPDVVVLDFSGSTGDLTLVRQLKNRNPESEVIVVGACDDEVPASEVLKAGASIVADGLTEEDGLSTLVERAIEQCRLRDENLALREELHGREQFEHIIGRSRVMQDLFDLIRSVAMSDANILIQGEHGTGKELIANVIHQCSQRAAGPFVKINCAALPKDLIESELFGHKRGSFTGASADRIGLLGESNGGSLLLDEIGEMPAYLQTKLLRVLQEREYRPIGSDQSVRVDFRLICATNVDPETALRENRLRSDLYFRVNTIALKVPPLRDRAEDIPLLCDHFLEKFRQRYQKHVRTLTPAVYHLLIRNRWPGNVRELENVIERAVLVSTHHDIGVEDLPDHIRHDYEPSAEFVIPPNRTLAEIEKMAILQTLQRTNWNKQEAAAILGLYRPTLYSKMRKHDIRDPRRGR